MIAEGDMREGIFRISKPRPYRVCKDRQKREPRQEGGMNRNEERQPRARLRWVGAARGLVDVHEGVVKMIIWCRHMGPF